MVRPLGDACGTLCGGVRNLVPADDHEAVEVFLVGDVARAPLAGVVRPEHEPVGRRARLLRGAQREGLIDEVRERAADAARLACRTGHRRPDGVPVGQPAETCNDEPRPVRVEHAQRAEFRAGLAAREQIPHALVRARRRLPVLGDRNDHDVGGDRSGVLRFDSHRRAMLSVALGRGRRHP